MKTVVTNGIRNYIKHAFDDMTNIELGALVCNSLIADVSNESCGAINAALYKTCEAGMDVKKLHNIILAASSKSKVRIIQTIGRGLRKHLSKAKAFVWDLVDDMTITSKKR